MSKMVLLTDFYLDLLRLDSVTFMLTFTALHVKHNLTYMLIFLEDLPSVKLVNKTSQKRDYNQTTTTTTKKSHLQTTTRKYYIFRQRISDKHEK